MQLTLTPDETKILHDMLNDYLPQLRLETARTEDREVLHEMVRRQDLCERLVKLLVTADPSR